MRSQVLKCFILQVKYIPMLHNWCNLEHKLLPCGGLQSKVAVAFARQRVHFCTQTIRFKSDSTGILYSEKRLIIVQHAIAPGISTRVNVTIQQGVLNKHQPKKLLITIRRGDGVA